MSGLALLVRARNPTWPNWKVFVQLTSTTAEDVYTPGWDPHTGYGLVRGSLAVGLTPPAVAASTISGKPKLTWASVPFATLYRVYSKITPTICPDFQLIGSTAGTAYTEQSIQFSSFLGYDVATPTVTAVSYQVIALANGVWSQASQVATYASTLTNPPC